MRGSCRRLACPPAASIDRRTAGEARGASLSLLRETVDAVLVLHAIGAVDGGDRAPAFGRGGLAVENLLLPVILLIAVLGTHATTQQVFGIGLLGYARGG